MHTLTLFQISIYYFFKSIFVHINFDLHERKFRVLEMDVRLYTFNCVVFHFFALYDFLRGLYIWFV